MKSISILGATGSIGQSALKIIDNFKDDIILIATSTHSNIDALLKIIDKYRPLYAVVSDANVMKKHFFSYETIYNGTQVYSGVDGINRICSDKRNDIILNGISGKAGLNPSIEILKNGIDIAIANKESIVCAGPILKKLSLNNNCKIIPVDSEHSAIFNLLKNQETKNIENIILTASGGPFLKLDKSRWSSITVEDALKHPTWKMGNKITIDSATMSNKGLEVIEAKELFGFDLSKVKVVIHPQSMVHSMIETIDGEIYAQIGINDMSIPIMNALFYPQYKNNSFSKFDFSKPLSFDFMPIDFSKFKMLEFAYVCGNIGGLYQTLFNSANEYLVNQFLKEKISFLDIELYTEKIIDIFSKNNLNNNELTLESINIVDREVERELNSLLS